MTRLREILDEYAPSLRFVHARDSNAVHIVAPDDPTVPSEAKALAELTTDEALKLALALRPTVCGLEVSVVPGGRGTYIGEFSDADLCGRCHRILGSTHQHLAFDHPQPGDPV
ncbi:Uncharacterised protein [Mycobacteroides abscessus subsp. abscessus]|uniref:hypothetical protein n=1 Tax=Mycobacteroides abscessus TaxID=36809 RepID=UPI000929BD9A|nr:hypothetical protein [Mycobacteroides abscessus]SIH19662.1 Uncharacterised protein [Mycobacteroides abscessus subsp. abscessus]